MDAAAIATSAMTMSQAKVQLAVAGKLAKTNADQAGSVAALVDAANSNMVAAAKAALPPGLGGHMDISV